MKKSDLIAALDLWPDDCEVQIEDPNWNGMPADITQIDRIPNPNGTDQPIILLRADLHIVDCE